MKIELCERTEDNVRTYFAATRDPKIAEMMPSVGSLDAALESYRKTLRPDATSYGRTIYFDGRYVGDIWCYCIDPDGEPNAMVSYCIFDKSLWSRGIATEALRQFSVDIRSRFGLKTVGAFAYLHNPASLRVLEKNGFSRVETFTEDGIESAYYQKKA